MTALPDPGSAEHVEGLKAAVIAASMDTDDADPMYEAMDRLEAAIEQRVHAQYAGEWLHETFPQMLRDPVMGMRLIGMWIEQDVDYMCGHEGAEECPDEDGCSLTIEPEAMYEALYEYAEVLTRARAALEGLEMADG